MNAAAERSVLVTGVGGGGVGEQIVKALRLAPRAYRVVGADTQPRSLGLQEVDVPVLLPLAAAPEYVDAVLGVCARLGIRAIYPGSEPELLALAAARQRFAAAGVVVFANSDAVIATGLDKAGTVAALARHGFKTPRTVAVRHEGDLASVDFRPAVLKPNRGGGSANVFVAQDDAELRLFASYCLRAGGDLIAQEYVGGGGDEYTVGVLSDLDGLFINSIAVRRSILSAFSNRSRARNRTGNAALGAEIAVSNGISQGEIAAFPAVTEPCQRIAEALGSRGPLNIQCRLVDGEVLVFEINPRFSGTTSLRALVGFNEPDLLFRRHVEGEALTARFAYRSGHVARGLREVLVDPALEGASVGAGDFLWRLPSLPFIYRPLETPSNGAGLPDALPFAVRVDGSTGLVQQAPDPAVAAALERAYSVGSEIPGLMEEHGIGREYAEDFLSLLADARDSPRFDGVSVLDIGCGTGYLLSRLRDLGAQVLGVEPGPHGQRGAATYRVPVVQDFFPCAGAQGRYDLAILYLVVEHLVDPSELLLAAKRQLSPGGRIALVVPDAESFLEEGDVSTLFHEHYSYFTAASLAATLRKLGADAIRIRRSPLSKLLFAMIGFGAGKAEDVPFDRPLAGSLALAHRFRRAATRTSERLARYLGDARAAGEPVAVYVPGRFVNQVALSALPLDGLRFFDDSAALHQRYFPGIPIAVESQADLVARPCPRVLIMSSSFGGRIKARIAPLLPATTRITTLDELR